MHLRHWLSHHVSGILKIELDLRVIQEKIKKYFSFKSGKSGDKDFFLFSWYLEETLPDYCNKESDRLLE